MNSAAWALYQGKAHQCNAPTRPAGNRCQTIVFNTYSWDGRCWKHTHDVAVKMKLKAKRARKKEVARLLGRA